MDMYCGLTLGVVVAVHPEGNSIDVVDSETGGWLGNVQVMSPVGSSNTGHMDLPDIGLPVGISQWDLTQAPGRYVQALLTHVRGMPICVGFLMPQVTAMTFQRSNFRVHRHASDVYETTNAQGDHEWSHPSGSMMRWGQSPAHEDLAGKDFDGQWAITQNKGSAPYLNIVVANAGSPVATLQFDPQGNVTLTHKGNLTVNTSGNAAVTVGGTTALDSTGDVTITAPQTTVEGPLTVTGPLVFQSGASGTAGSGGGPAMSITGDVHSTGTVTGDVDVIAGTISGKGHKHTSESPGTPTSTPIAGG
jgi:phage baseplate assembly protein gpV